jgi:2-oxoisovalerate dehydrogenase E1 component alpha subunit
LFKRVYRREASGTFDRSPEELRGSSAVTQAVDVRRLTPHVLTRRPGRVVRLLGEDGSRLADPEWDAAVAALTDAALLGLYEDMVVVRSLDATATNLQRQGELALWPPLLGQEAAQVGSARMLAPGDFAFSSYREHAVAYCRGATPTELVRVWRGVALSGWDPYAIGMATPQVVVGAQALHATGWALGALWEDAGQAAIAYFGDGATSEGDTCEAMVFAASFGAPVVFFCQNNGWAISEPVSLQTPVSIAGRAAGFGMPAVVVDGNDVLAVAAVTARALERARSGAGPSFIEAVTYRMGPHTTADDPTRYRDEAEVAAWRGRDPVTRLRTYLEGVGVLDADRVRAVDERARQAAAEMRAGCAGLVDPDPLSVFDHVYVDDHADLARQRARYARHLAAFADEPA